jgi:hypothetical protein
MRCFAKELSIPNDNFEPNNSFDKATINKEEHYVSANINTESDLDYYRFEVTDEDVQNSEYFSFILSNIPANCNYGFCVVDNNMMGWNYNNPDNTTENAVFKFKKPGAYFLLRDVVKLTMRFITVKLVSKLILKSKAYI